MKIADKAGLSTVLTLCGRVLLLCLASTGATAQIFQAGDDPSSLKWEQIRTGHFQVIFPEGFTQEARRMTSVLEAQYDTNAAVLDHRPGRIPVILHNQSVSSNGFVTWAPKRMELVTTPPPGNYTGDYFEQLALHEFRHVVQVDKIHQGVTKFLYYLVGQQSYGVAGMMPLWFIEGNAVDAETRLSLTGRGRQPFFEMEMKAILGADGKPYSYEKAYFGSFRDNVPDYYELGYQMVAHARDQYGEDVWKKMIDYTARRPYSLYPFYFGLKKFTGSGKRALYEETCSELGEHWARQAEERTATGFTKRNTRQKRSFTSYGLPQYVDDGTVFAIKSGVDMIGAFVLIDGRGKEKKVYVPGYYHPEAVCVCNNTIAWTETVRDVRWARRSYSVVKTLRIGQTEEKVLGWNSRYFSPDLSPDAGKVAVVEVNTENHSALVIIDSGSGNRLDSIPAPAGSLLQESQWALDQEGFFAIVQGRHSKSVVRFEPERNRWVTLFDGGLADITELCASQHYLWFRGTFSGIDNIYALDLADDSVYRVTSSRYGAYAPDVSPGEDRLLYSEYTPDGFDVAEAVLDPESWVKLEDLPENREQLYPAAPDENSDPPVDFGADEEIPQAEPFRKYRDIFQFHSWAPFYMDYEHPGIGQDQVAPGLTLLSQNKLGTAVTLLGYRYSMGRQTLHGSFTYSGFYPVIRIGAVFGGSPFVGSAPEGTAKPDGVPPELNLNMALSIPLDLTMNKMVSGLRSSVEASHDRSYFYYDGGGYRSGMTYMTLKLNGYSYLKPGSRDFFPRWGVTGNLNFLSTPYDHEQLGSMFSAQGALYIPGILRHQVIRTWIGYQGQQPRRYVFGNFLSFPRGVHPDRMIKMKKVAFDYVLPLGYPDLRVGGLAYIKRVRAGLFYDYALGENVQMEDRTFRSMGVDLTMDVHLLQVLFPFNAGIRLGYLPQEGNTFTQMIFNIDLSMIRSITFREPALSDLLSFTPFAR